MNSRYHDTTSHAIFLDAAALKELTGFAQKQRQIEQLKAMGIPFWINHGGRPVVSRAAVEGGKAPKPVARAWTPEVLKDR